jgi:hypothetical protein
MLHVQGGVGIMLMVWSDREFKRPHYTDSDEDNGKAKDQSWTSVGFEISTMHVTFHFRLLCVLPLW